MDDGNLKNMCHVVGSRQTLRALKEKKALKVVLAQDANEYAVKEIKALCSYDDVQVIYVQTMRELGNSCGIDRPAAAAAIIKQS